MKERGRNDQKTGETEEILLNGDIKYMSRVEGTTQKQQSRNGNQG